ncbi:Uncharacterized protein Rs2_31691 [Raphanus sativus]|nr:Uncharacterized protein Rs2_31691 [Raphanus sativus]
MSPAFWLLAHARGWAYYDHYTVKQLEWKTHAWVQLNASGFIQSVSAAVWRNQKPKESLTSNKDHISRKKSVNGGYEDASSALDPAPPAVPTPREAHTKLMASVGLQIDSAHGRKTENLKETYSLGRKLGQEIACKKPSLRGN